MKIPYKVSLNTRQAYDTAPFMQTTTGEAPRKIVAENFEWDDEITPAPLTFYAALSLSRAFEIINPLEQILQKDVDILMDLYSSSIPLRYSVPYIKYERYWERAFRHKFPSKLEAGIKFWKRKYLSTCLQSYLEKVNPDVFLEDEAVELATLVSPFIYFLGLNELQMVRQPLPPVPYDDEIQDVCQFSVVKVFDHIPLEPVLRVLYNLRELSLVFGINDIQDAYQTRFFEFSIKDCESICRGLQSLKHLKIFRINRSNLDCSKVKVILENLVRIETIEELDFNHCKIGNYGMKALGGFITIHKNVKIIRIANNRFKEEGIQGIAYALQIKPAAPIELLDFSLNPMSLQCATMFAAAFVRCMEKPQTLIVNSCGFSGPSAEKMAGLLCLNRGLTKLAMAANDLSGEAEKTLIRALEQNRKVLDIDLRMTKISDETKKRVAELLQRNKDLVGQELEPSDEIPPLYLNEPEYLIWEYNPNNPNYIPGRYPERVAEI